MIIDFFKDNSDFGNEVYIIGPHPSVYDAFGFIDIEGFQIVLNKAILIPEINPSLWLVADSSVPSEAWFKDGLKRVRKDGNPVRKMFSYDVIKEMSFLDREQVDIGFRQYNALSTEDFCPSYGDLRYNGTCFAQALQAAFWKDVKKIKVAGVAFEGNQYFDGTRNPKQAPSGHWDGLLHIVNNLISYMEKEGFELWSMSQTALNLKRLSPSYGQS